MSPKMLREFFSNSSKKILQKNPKNICSSMKTRITNQPQIMIFVLTLIKSWESKLALPINKLIRHIESWLSSTILKWILHSNQHRNSFKFQGHTKCSGQKKVKEKRIHRLGFHTWTNSMDIWKSFLVYNQESDHQRKAWAGVMW